MRSVLVLILTMSVVAGCTTKSGTISEARALFNEKKYDQSLVMLRELSDSGDTAAQFDLANLYANGWGVESDQVLAEELWAKSCSGNYYHSCTNIGQRHMYYGNYHEAESALLKAGKNGDKLAASYLAKLYRISSWSGMSLDMADYWSAEAKYSD